LFFFFPFFFLKKIVDAHESFISNKERKGEREGERERSEERK